MKLGRVVTGPKFQLPPDAFPREKPKMELRKTLKRPLKFIWFFKFLS